MNIERLQVDFDSVFNQSSTTFSFGSPDILPMFAHGAIPGKVKTWCYSEDDEDFTKGYSLLYFLILILKFCADAIALDLWVLDQLQVLFKNATTDTQTYDQLHSEGVVFFLHLLGLDTTGHSYRPHSKVCALCLSPTCCELSSGIHEQHCCCRHHSATG